MVAWTMRVFALAFCAAAVLALTASNAPATAGTLGQRAVFGAPFISVKPLLSAQQAQARLVSVRTIDMRSVPAATAQSYLLRPRVIPFRAGVDPATYQRMKSSAEFNFRAPTNRLQLDENLPAGPLLPTVASSFQGMADSGTVCPPSGCQPPDQALAASSLFIMQGVNTSFDVFNTSGVSQTGWPKAARSFFGVPNPGPCNPNGAFMSDPRAFFDPNTGRFWVAMLQVDGPAINDTCSPLTKYWIAVSATTDPRGAWHIYAFDMSGGTSNFADYTTFGFDQSAVYFSGNMFSQITGQFMYDEIFGANKTKMASGLAVTAHGFNHLAIGGVDVDTVQPVETEQTTGPGVELFVNSLNMNFGGGLCSGGCTGVAVWAFANVLTTPTLSGLLVPTKNYFLAPNANEPGCVRCIETIDTRISGQPVVSGGNIYFALETGVFTGTSVVPGVFWGELKPTLSAGKITGGSVVQSGLESFTGTRAASFGALTLDKTGDVLMVFDSMSSTLNPGIYVTGRKPTDVLGTLEAPATLQAGVSFTLNSRWGDYEAASYDGFTDNKIWVAAQYAPADNDWATKIGQVHL